MKNIASIFLLLLITNTNIAQSKVSFDISFKNFKEFQDLNYYRVSCNILKPISPFSFGHKSGLFNNKGEFSFSSQIDYPTLAIISWFGQSIFLSVFPGDSIKLEINASGKNEDLHSLVKIHSKSNFEIDSYIYELNKEVGGIRNKISVKEKIKKDNLGNIVFIDFWGTWCGACLYDIKHKKELGMDEIFDKFSVRTVYLCKTSPKKEFDFYVKKLDMKGDHYFLSKDLAQDAKINFNVIFYPHYMLFNKKGELINNVPRPIITSGGDISLNKELIKMIEQLNE